MFHKGEPRLALKPSSFGLLGLKNNQIEKLTMAGEVEVSENGFAQDQARFQVGNLTLNKFHFSKIFTAFVYDSDQDLLVGLSDGFGLNDLRITDLRFSDGRDLAYLSSGKIMVSNQKTADLEVKGFTIKNSSKTVTTIIGAASLMTLDLTMLDHSTQGLTFQSAGSLD